MADLETLQMIDLQNLGLVVEQLELKAELEMKSANLVEEEKLMMSNSQFQERSLPEILQPNHQLIAVWKGNLEEKRRKTDLAKKKVKDQLWKKERKRAALILNLAQGI